MEELTQAEYAEIVRMIDSVVRDRFPWVLAIYQPTYEGEVKVLSSTDEYGDEDAATLCLRGFMACAEYGIISIDLPKDN
jgi:hypothetical protein